MSSPDPGHEIIAPIEIEAYQEELAPVAMRVFMRVMGMPVAQPATADPRMAALAEQYDVLTAAATFINEHITRTGCHARSA